MTDTNPIHTSVDSSVDEMNRSPICRFSSETFSHSLDHSFPAGSRSSSISPLNNSDVGEPQAPDLLQQGQAGGPKITYARQRSFLSEANVNEEVCQLKENKLDITPTFSRVEPDGATLSGKDVPYSVEDSGTIGNNALRSIYELRQAGGNARFQGIIDSIFEDIEDDSASTSSKRSSLIQLGSKLIDYQFARRFLGNALEKRLANCIIDQSDIIYMFLIACVYALLLSAGPMSSLTLRTCCSQIQRVAPQLLREGEDILGVAKARGTKMSKASQAALQDFCLQIRECKNWPNLPPLQASPQVMALLCIEMSVRKVSETGDTVTGMSDSVLNQLIDLLLGHSLEETSNDLFAVELELSILETYTSTVSFLGEGQEAVVRRLSQLGPHLSNLQLHSESRSRQIQMLEIRLILNITNNNPRLCDDFSIPDLVGALAGIILSNFGLVSEDSASDKKDSVLDTVILALGALINLTEWSGSSRKLIFKLRNASTTLLDGFLLLFAEGWEAVSEVSALYNIITFSCSY
jgi:hypothetical protein